MPVIERFGSVNQFFQSGGAEMDGKSWRPLEPPGRGVRCPYRVSHPWDGAWNLSDAPNLVIPRGNHAELRRNSSVALGAN